MGATSSRPSDAELSWDTELYRYDVRSIPGKSYYFNHAPGSIRRDTYVISVNKRNSAGRPKARERSYEEPDDNWVGVDLLNLNNDSGDIDGMQLRVKPSSTTWEALCSNFEKTILSWQRSESCQHEDVEIVTPVEYECVANCRSSYVRPWWSLKLVDWHKPVSEITEGCEFDCPVPIFCEIRKVDPEQLVIKHKTWADTWVKYWADISSRSTDRLSLLSALASRLSDADLSWETDEYRFDVTTAFKKDVTRHHCYLISVSKHDNVATPSEDEPEASTVPREIGFTIMWPGKGHRYHFTTLTRPTSTVWEAFRLNFEEGLFSRARFIGSDDDEYYYSDEEVDYEGTYECVAVYGCRSGNNYIKRDDWHKAIGEIVESEELHKSTPVLCSVYEAEHEMSYWYVGTGPSSTVSKTDSKTSSISEMFETISLSTLLCGIVIGMMLAKLPAEKAP